MAFSKEAENLVAFALNGMDYRLNEKESEIYNKLNDMHTLTNEEWKVISNNPHFKFTLQSLILDDRIPTKELEQFITNDTGPIVKFSLLKREDISADAIKKILKTTAKMDIINYYKDFLFFGMEPFSQKALDYIAWHYPEEYEYYPVAFMSNKFESEALDAMIDEQDQGFFIAIANNKNLRDETRNTAYDKADTYEGFSNFTSYMKNANYQMAIETITEIKDADDTREARMEANRYIEKSIENGRLTQEAEADLIYRSFDIGRSMDIIPMIAKHTKNSLTLRTIIDANVPVNVKLLATQNPHMNDKDMGLCIRHIKSSLERKDKFSDFGIEAIGDLYCRFATARKYMPQKEAESFYIPVIKYNNRDIFKKLIANNDMPAYVIDTLTESKMPDIAFYAKLAKKLRQKDQGHFVNGILNTIYEYNIATVHSEDTVRKFKDKNYLDTLFNDRKLKMKPYEWKTVRDIIGEVYNECESPTHKRKLHLFILQQEFNTNKDNRLKNCDFLKEKNGKYELHTEWLYKLPPKIIQYQLSKLSMSEVQKIKQDVGAELLYNYSADKCKFYSELEHLGKLFNCIEKDLQEKAKHHDYFFDGR